MTLEYRQYEYGGSYSIEQLQLPEDSHIYEVAMWVISFKVKDKSDTYTPGYVIKAPQKFQGSMQIGDAWYRFMYGIYIDESSFPVENIGSCMPPKDCFLVFEQDNMNAKRNPIVREMVDENGNLVDIDWEELHEYYKEVAGIGKIKRFTRSGIECSLVSIKNIASDDIVEVSIHTFEYGFTWGGGHTVHSRNFFTTDDKYKRMYNDKLDEYFKLFKQ